MPKFIEAHPRVVEAANRGIIQIYKAVGFTALLAILTGLIAFFSLNLFYLFDRSWLAPIILSPRHERVIELSAQLAQQTHQRGRLIAERRALQIEARDAERRLALQRELSRDYARAIAGARDATRMEANELRKLDRQLDRRRRTIEDQRARFDAHVRGLLEAQRAAGLVVEDQIVTAEHQLSELDLSNIALARDALDLQVELRTQEQRLAALEHLAAAPPESSDAETPSSTRDDAAAPVPLPPELLELRRDSAEVQIATLALEERLSAVQAELALVDQSIAQYDRILAELSDSPYLRAMDGPVTIAFVPYDNLDVAEPGTSLYGCHLQLVGCRRVGRIVRLIDGEVAARHPLTHRDVRGQMVEVDLEHGAWGRDEALFAGKRPLWLL